MRSLFSCCCFTLILLAGSPSTAKELSPKEILDRVDDLYRGRSSHGTMTMKVVTEHWTREVRIEAWSLGTEKSLLRILSPRKEKGTATLKSDNNIWNYLPKVKRVIKVPSSMMGGSWMGSHFTNDDLVKESRMAQEYDFAFAEAPNPETAVVVCTPKPDAAVVWGKVDVHLRRSDWMPLEIRYFDEDLLLARTMTYSKFAKMGGRLVPTVMRVVPVDKPNELTEVTYEKITFDLPLNEGKFTLRSLQR